MKKVSKQEYEFLYFLKELFGTKNSLAFPKDIPLLSEITVEIAEDMFRKYVPQLLISLGGWKKERCLDGNKMREGRLWQRHPDLNLTMSPGFVHLITNKGIAPETPGDYLSQYIIGRKIAINHHNPLIFIIHPENKKMDFKVVSNSWVMEALQEDFAAFWVKKEKEKQALVDWKKVRDVGLAQECVLDYLFKEIERTKRYDLARFLFLAIKELGTPVYKHNVAPRLADRQEVWRAVTVLPRAFQRMKSWYTASGYFDEDYSNTQLFKKYWEDFGGQSIFDQGVKTICELDPLKPQEVATA